MTRRGAGRPPKYSEDRAERILEALRSGATYEDAARYGGISTDTLTRWRDKYADFAERFLQAEAEAVVSLLRTIRNDPKGGWQAAAWILRNRYPDRYGGQQAAPPATPVALVTVADLLQQAGAGHTGQAGQDARDTP